MGGLSIEPLAIAGVWKKGSLDRYHSFHRRRRLRKKHFIDAGPNSPLPFEPLTPPLPRPPTLQ